MEPEIVLYLARHGRTELNEQNVFRGDKDPPLDKNGFKDANELSFYFKPIDLSFIVCSSKIRAATTAEIIYLGKVTDCEHEAEQLCPVNNELLKPWNVGIFGGKPKNEENTKLLQQYVDNPYLPVPGGTSLNEFKGRIHPLLKEAAEIGIQTGVPGLLVVHSSIIHEAGEFFGNHHEDAHVKPGGVAAVYISGNSIGIKPIFKVDDRATTQNVLGTGKRSSLNS